MNKLNYKNILILILMGVASIGVARDLITLLSGAIYTWFGLVTGFAKVILLGLCVDVIRG